jgi:hypothetical protein
MLHDAGFGPITVHTDYQAGKLPTGVSDTVRTFDATPRVTGSEEFDSGSGPS